MTSPGGGVPGRRRVGLVAGLLVFVALVLLPPPAGMPVAAWRTAAAALLMAIWWVTEAIPLAATALIPLAVFPFLGVAEIGPAAAPYANPVIFLFLGGFLIASGLEASGLHRRIALAILNAVGPRPARVVGGFMAAAAFVSLWVSNTATVAMFLPLALSVAALVDRAGAEPRDAEYFGAALLLGLAAAANIGGLGTLIGTPPNALLAGFMEETYRRPIGFAQWMLVGIPLVLLALPIAWFLLVRVLFPVRMAEVPGGRALLERERAGLGKPSREELAAGAIAGLAAAAWVTRPWLERVLPGLSDAGIAIIAGLLVFLITTPRARAEGTAEWDRFQALPWGVLLLFGGGLSLAEAMQTSGLASWLGDWLRTLERLPLGLMVLLVTALLVFLTELASNTAIAAALLPVSGALASGIGADPLLLAVPVALAASCGFMLPVGTPPNAMVYGTGRIRMSQMVRSGLWLDLLMIGLVTATTLLLVEAVLA
ncbi:MAG: SLC13 family permease [Gemmatimonadales bacterium]